MKGRLKLDDVSAATSRILEHIKSTYGEEVEIHEDFYWDVPEDARYDPYSEPKSLTLGQLSDDLDEVVAIAKDEKEVVGYALVWLASVLRRIGETNPG